MTGNNGAGEYTQPIVMTLKNHGPLTGRELNNQSDLDFQISQSSSTFYRCLRDLQYLGFVQKISDRYELTSFGNELATRSEDTFYNYYSLGYIRCPECRREGNLVKCDIEDITKLKRRMGVSVRCPICGYTRAPNFLNISKEKFIELYNSI